MTDNAVRLTYQQYRAVRRLVHDCCNYQDGNCLLLDDGEECVCPQSISYSLICRWFRAAVLPLDENLCAALLHRRERKKCVLCGGWYIPKSNRAKYCPECAKEEERRKTAHFSPTAPLRAGHLGKVPASLILGRTASP